MRATEGRWPPHQQGRASEHWLNLPLADSVPNGDPMAELIVTATWTAQQINRLEMMFDVQQLGNAQLLQVLDRHEVGDDTTTGTGDRPGGGRESR